MTHAIHGGTVRLTLAQALVRHLAALRIELDDGRILPWCAGVWSIFGHGNVAGLGDALWSERDRLPTYRAHNEQAMAHTAIAFAKACARERIMAVTTSVGPGATNLVTAAGLAHVNRLPVLLLPGDTFNSRAPDPVLQQLEDPAHGDFTVNDTLRPVTRYFDRITRPQQILVALPRAIAVLTDPAQCGPVCLALPQDVQAEAFDCPVDFLSPPMLRVRRTPPEARELGDALRTLRSARRPLIIAGGGVLYAQASKELAAFAEIHGIPVAETQAGKSSLAWDHPLNLGAIGVTGSPAANTLAREADLVVAIGTRLQDFTTGSHTLFARARLLGLNVQAFDAMKWGAQALVGDARTVLQQLTERIGSWRADASWTTRAGEQAEAWRKRVTELTCASVPEHQLPAGAEVIGAVRDSTDDSSVSDVVVCAAGTLPAELHKLWRAGRPGNYHVEYGFSCMGYEIAGGLGAKFARPDAEVIVLVGDGSYLMMNSEIATAVMLGRKLIVVLLDNRGYGCIHRLQQASGGARFNNLLVDCVPTGGADCQIDFAAHARSLGANAVHVASLDELKPAMSVARASPHTWVIVIDTAYSRVTEDGGCWWEVGIPAQGSRPQIAQAHDSLLEAKRQQRI